MKMTDAPTPGKRDFVGQDGKVYHIPKTAIYRLLHDDEGVEKGEDRYPANTFSEVYLLVIAVMSILTFLSEIVQMVASFKELFR